MTGMIEKIESFFHMKKGKEMSEVKSEVQSPLQAAAAAVSMQANGTVAEGATLTEKVNTGLLEKAEDAGKDTVKVAEEVFEKAETKVGAAITYTEDEINTAKSVLAAMGHNVSHVFDDVLALVKKA